MICNFFRAILHGQLSYFKFENSRFFSKKQKIQTNREPNHQISTQKNIKNSFITFQ